MQGKAPYGWVSCLYRALGDWSFALFNRLTAASNFEGSHVCFPCGVFPKSYRVLIVLTCLVSFNCELLKDLFDERVWRAVSCEHLVKGGIDPSKEPVCSCANAGALRLDGFRTYLTASVLIQLALLHVWGPREGRLVGAETHDTMWLWAKAGLLGQKRFWVAFWDCNLLLSLY